MERGLSGNGLAIGVDCLSPAVAPEKVSQYETNRVIGGALSSLNLQVAVHKVQGRNLTTAR